MPHHLLFYILSVFSVDQLLQPIWMNVLKSSVGNHSHLRPITVGRLRKAKQQESRGKHGEQCSTNDAGLNVE